MQKAYAVEIRALEWGSMRRSALQPKARAARLLDESEMPYRKILSLQLKMAVSPKAFGHFWSE